MFIYLFIMGKKREKGVHVVLYSESLLRSIRMICEELAVIMIHSDGT